MIEAVGLTNSTDLTRPSWTCPFEVQEGEVVAFLAQRRGQEHYHAHPDRIHARHGGTGAHRGPGCVEQSMEARRRVGYMPEHIALYPDMRVTEYLTYCGRLEDMGATS